jgi:hypothetical protein
MKAPGYLPLLAALLSICEGAKAATTWVVTSTADAGAGSLRDMIVNKAIAGDTIGFAPTLTGSTITLNTGELLINKDLTVTGLGPLHLTIMGVNQRVFHISNNNGPITANISGLHMRGSFAGAPGADGTVFSPNGQPGTAAEGGGILNDASCLLIVSNCFMEGCQVIGGRGGNAFGSSFDPAANGGNGAAAYGGAIGSEGNLILHCSAFASNSATAGNGGNGVAGGAGGNGGAVSINIGPFGAAGGAIYAGYNSALEIVDCTFYANYAIGGNGGNGGGGHIDITHQAPGNGGSGGNGSDAAGGGIYITKGCDPGSCAGIKHATIDQNVCSPGTGGQGGLGIFGGNNGANGAGGAARGCGLYASAALPLGNNIIAENYALPSTLIPAGPDVWGAIFSGAQTGMHNLIGVVDLHSSGWTTVDLTGSLVTPINPLLGTFRINGGETPTMAPLAGSPAIDAGIVDGAVFDTTVGIFIDQIGQLRKVPITGNANGDGTDIGAYELQCSLDAPALSVSHSVTNVIITWPWPSTCFVLQQSSDLSTTNWVNCGYPISVNGNQNQVVISPPQGNLFFRLKK